VAARPWRTFFMISIGVFASLLDLFIVNIAFPDIGQEFAGTDLRVLSWVLSAYAIGFAALLVPAGRLADLYGRKRGYVIGLGLFTLASAACAAAPSAGWLITARVLQAVGAAILAPSSLGVVLQGFPARARPSVVAAWAAVGAFGAAAGPPLGGLLAQASWRWVFLLNLPLGIVSIWYAIRRVQESRDPTPGPRRLPDLAGTLALAIGIGALVLALVQGRDWGWDSGGTLATFAVAAVMLAAAVFRSARHPVPALEFSMLRVPTFALAVSAGFAFFVAFAALLLASVLFLTQVWGHSILRAGLELAPGPATALGFAVVASRLGPRVGMTRLGGFGGVLVACGVLFTSARVGLVPDYPADFLPGALVIGAGIGLSIPAFTATVVGAVEQTRFATAIGTAQMFQQVGAGLGVAVFVAIVGTPDAAHAIAAFGDGWRMMAVAAASGSLLILAAGRGGARPRVAVTAVRS
jgi:MFS family permease